MRKALFLVLIACVAGWLTGCGDSKKSVIQPQIGSFAFMQDAGGYLFTPMLGKYTTTGATTVFTVSAVLDPSTNEPVTGEFYSIALSPDGIRAVVDLYGGQNGDSGQWDIFVADSGGRGDLAPITTLGRSAVACSNDPSNSAGSICAMTCPFFTRELKSAYRREMVPET